MRRQTITSLILVGLAFFTFNSSAMARDGKKYREVKVIKTSKVINVSADSLWNLVKEFDKVGEYLSGIDRTVGSGEPEFEGATCSNRTCHVNLKGYNEVHEKLTMFNPAKRELAYEFLGGGPPFLLFAGNHWTVTEIGPNQCKLNMEATMHLKKFAGFLFGGKLQKTIERELPISLDEIKLYAETGEISEAKKARNKELEEKQKKKAA